LPWQRPLTDPETNTRLNIYTNMSTIPEKFGEDQKLSFRDLFGPSDRLKKKNMKESNSSIS